MNEWWNKDGEKTDIGKNEKVRKQEKKVGMRERRKDGEREQKLRARR